MTTIGTLEITDGDRPCDLVHITEGHSRFRIDLSTCPDHIGPGVGYDAFEWAQDLLDTATGDSIPNAVTKVVQRRLETYIDHRFGCTLVLDVDYGSAHHILRDFIDVYRNRYGTYTAEPDYDFPGLSVAYQHALYAVGEQGDDHHLCSIDDHTALVPNAVCEELTSAVQRALVPGWGLDALRREWDELYDVYQRVASHIATVTG